MRNVYDMFKKKKKNEITGPRWNQLLAPRIVAPRIANQDFRQFQPFQSEILNHSRISWSALVR